jgi:uncharacterized membrane protein YkvA (DUF1232 family)
MNVALRTASLPIISTITRRMKRRAQASPSHVGPQARLKNPKLSVLFGILAVLYTLWPIDLIPDVIPFLGWLDDGLALYFAFRQVREFASSQAHARRTP